MNKREKKILCKIDNIIKETYRNLVGSNLEHFSGFYKIYKHEFKKPILVSSTDGVGTKIRLLINYKKYHSIGIDCFAMCVNDILCHGAHPLFFLDYLACNQINSKIIESIVQGITSSCKKTNTCFIGGETAEMPGIYHNHDYDIAGFCVGMVESDHLIDGKKLIQEGDLVIGIPSSGIHSNGFSLIRKIFSEKDYETYLLNQTPLYEILLKPTKIYYTPIHNLLLKKFFIHGIAHITGGGILHNLSRILPNKLSSIIKKKEIPIQKIFSFIQKIGNLSDETMWNTFNMGVGMIIVADSKKEKLILNELRRIGENPFVFGKIIKGNKKVLLKE